MGYSARILADSLSPAGVRLTTFEVSFPRIVLAEFNTHRTFSRNSASSRAIPIATMLKKVKEDPFVPFYWGKNQKGMQASEELAPDAQQLALRQWMRARNNAIRVVKRMQLPDIDLHKQIANRLLEPWLWHTVIVTATEWENFFALRCNREAQPEIRKIACIMKELYDSSTPKPLRHGQWHLPLVEDYDVLVTNGYSLTDIVKICIGRCTRVSYLTHDGVRDPKADVELCERLLKSGHMSPFEHAARPSEASCVGFYGNFKDWIQARKLVQHEDNFSKVVGADRPFELHGLER